MPSFFKQRIAIAFIALLSVNVFAAERAPQQINDLRYGEALYHFYQEQYFTSITKLMAAKQRNPITSQDVDPEILLGGLYLYYGLHQSASHLLTDLIKNYTSQSSQDRAWFNIGKMHFKSQLYTEAYQALNKVQTTLSAEREAERQNMLANIYLKQGDYPSVFNAIDNLSAHQDWLNYAKYNAGVTLIKSGHNDEGTDLLNQISSLKTEDEELKALRDKTNLALGFAYIRQQLPEYASQYLQKVRLKGPLSAKALLGIGWAYQQQDKLEQALVAWMELRNWPVVDTAVQESLLAIPFTLEQMEKNQLALQHYNYAIDNYKEELENLESVINSVKAGELLFILRPAMVTENVLNSDYDVPVTGSISAPYLQYLVNIVDFQEIHKNYLDLIYLQKSLIKWKNQFPAYHLMLSERKGYYKNQQASLKKNVRLNFISTLQNKRNKLARQVRQIENKENIYTIATEDETYLLKKLDKIKTSLNRLNKSGEYQEENEKYKFYRGLLLWDISTDYAPRYWKVKDELKQVDDALNIATERLHSIRDANRKAPRALSTFNSRIKKNEKKLNKLLNKVTLIIRNQEKALEKQALFSLKQRHKQVENYYTHARYSLAHLYDRITLPKSKSKSKSKNINKNKNVETSVKK